MRNKFKGFYPDGSRDGWEGTCDSVRVRTWSRIVLLLMSRKVQNINVDQLVDYFR